MNIKMKTFLFKLMRPKISLLVGLGFLLVSTVGVFGYRSFSERYKIKPKEKVLGEQKTELSSTPIPTSTSIFTATPTSKPTYKPEVISSPMPTLEPEASEPQKVPVYLVYDGSTKMCDPSASEAVQAASNSIVEQKKAYDLCLVNLEKFLKDCVEQCQNDRSYLMNLCYQAYEFNSPSFISCRNENEEIFDLCLEECKKKGSSTTCPSINYDSINSLINTYCE